METVKKFYEALQADKAMQERANSLNEQYKGTDPASIDEKAVAAEIVEFAKGEGYDFTATDLEAYQKGMRALDDEELDAVAGGLFMTGVPDCERDCYCIIGGGGADPEEDGAGTCACILGGGGYSDKEGNYLWCIFGGAIYGKNGELM